MQDEIKLFEKRQVRSVWDEEQEKWWFSVLDIIAVLTDQPDYKKVRNYWKWLKNKLKAEGSDLFSDNELVSFTNQLKMLAADGKYYKTDVADIEQILRLIQSIPSPKAEPFKRWLAQVGRESAKIAHTGATVARNARLEIEEKGGKVISAQNAKGLGTRKEQNKLKM
jgi:hypothetical protein